MQRPARALAVLVLAAGVSACDGGEPQEPAAPATSTAPSGAASQVAAVPAPPPAFFQCATCHSVEPGKNRTGPTLHGIVGSPAGKVPGFAYSTALKQSGLTWDRATLEQFLAGPSRMVPGTRMVTIVPDPVRRKEIIDYLERLK